MKIKESVVLQRRTYLTFILVIGLIICLRTTRKRHLKSRMRHSTVWLCGPRSNESFHTSLNLSITTNYSVLHFLQALQGSKTPLPGLPAAQHLQWSSVKWRVLFLPPSLFPSPLSTFPVKLRPSGVSHPSLLRDSLEEADLALPRARGRQLSAFSVCVVFVVCVVGEVIKVISSGYQPSPGERASLSKVGINNETHKKAFSPNAGCLPSTFRSTTSSLFISLSIWRSFCFISGVYKEFLETFIDCFYSFLIPFHSWFILRR